MADLPDDECEGVKPASSQPCYRTPCSGGPGHGGGEEEEEEEEEEDREGTTLQREELHDWEYEGFTECSQSCGGGTDLNGYKMLMLSQCSVHDVRGQVDRTEQITNLN